MVFRLIRAVVLLVVLVAAAAFLLGWWGSGRVRPVPDPQAVGTTGRPAIERPQIDREKAREVGAEVGEKTAVAAETARRAMADGSLTAKIKAKMALDDSVKAMNIDIDTRAGVVTLNGTVDNESQHARAVALARETAGVTQVVDRLQVRK
jgi:BON domain-containing protein